MKGLGFYPFHSRDFEEDPEGTKRNSKALDEKSRKITYENVYDEQSHSCSFTSSEGRDAHTKIRDFDSLLGKRLPPLHLMRE